MGYITNFEFHVYEASEFPGGDHLPEDEEEKIFDDLLKYNITDMKYEWLEEGAKWYDWRPHLTSLSKHHPGMVLTLDGAGEESGDVWEEIFFEGKSVGAQQVSFMPAINLSSIGLKDPTDPTPPPEEPENSYFFASE